MDLYEGFDRTPCFVFVCLQPKADFAQPKHATVLREWYLVCLGAAMENLMVAATALGLGTRWFGGFALDEGGAALKEMLGIPPGVEVIAATPLGYHDEPPKPRPPQDLADAPRIFAGATAAGSGACCEASCRMENVVHRERW